MEPPISHQDVTTIMGMLGGIQSDVREIRLLLEEEEDGDEEAPEDDA